MDYVDNKIEVLEQGGPFVVVVIILDPRALFFVYVTDPSLFRRSYFSGMLCNYYIMIQLLKAMVAF